MDATTFPISITYHVVFCTIACIFFIIQYVRTKKSYQLLLAIGIPASLCIYINPESSSLFYSMGVFEAVLLAGAIVFAFVERSRRKQEIEDTTPLPAEETPVAPDQTPRKPVEEVSAAPADTDQAPEGSDSENTDGEQK